MISSTDDRQGLRVRLSHDKARYGGLDVDVLWGTCLAVPTDPLHCLTIR